LVFSGTNLSGVPFADSVLPADDVPENRENAKGYFDRHGGYTLVGDALVSDIQNKFLVIQIADCQSILIYDAVRQVVANIHSGWRGSIKNIIGRTIQVMETVFGCNSRHMVAGIGPSLGPCCAEFVNYKTEIPEKFWKYKDNRDHFDFWAVSRDQLCDAGVLVENIECSDRCTRCDTQKFFSFRKEGTTGRFAAVIGLTG
ncbi:MAG: polyphenol oxidase family protein, partial [Proteobacteria bacterium]|nr:polyphenol oxidase family protein [Pseudomonadota bacterium]